MAAHGLSHQLKLQPSDLVLYSAKVIPGNDTRVMQVGAGGLVQCAVPCLCWGWSLTAHLSRSCCTKSLNVCPPPPLPGPQMMNAISQLGPEIAMGRDENLHTSGHAYK